MNPPTLLILAAGMGSRYGGLKQLDAMGPNGETMLDYAVADAIEAGFGKVVFVIRRDFEAAFHQHISSRYDQRIPLEFAYQSREDLPAGFTPPPERTKPWGTAQAVYAARGVISEPFAVINADDYYGSEAYVLLADRLSSLSGLATCMVGYRLEKTLSPHGSVNRGVCQLKDAQLRKVEEYTGIEPDSGGVIHGNDLEGTRRELAPDTAVSMNCWGFTPDIFATIEAHLLEFLKVRGQELKSECYIPTVVDEMIEKKLTACEVMLTQSPWFGVTYPEDKPRVVEALKSIHGTPCHAEAP